MARNYDGSEVARGSRWPWRGALRDCVAGRAVAGCREQYVKKRRHSQPSGCQERRLRMLRGDLPPEHIFKSRWLQACGSQVVETQFLPWPCPAPATSTDLSPPQDTAHWEGLGPFLQDSGPSLSPYPPAPSPGATRRERVFQHKPAAHLPALPAQVLSNASGHKPPMVLCCPVPQGS